LSIKGDLGPQGPPGERGEKGERGEVGPQGKLPIVRAWNADTISYEGNVVTHRGSLWQAQHDTAKAPGESPDWICLAAAGAPGRSLNIRGTYREGESYDALDVVAKDGSWFAARRSNAGACPGPDWQVGPSGKRGEKGERGYDGAPGPRGEAGRAGRDAKELVGFQVSRKDYTLTAIMSDGSEGPTIPLRELFDEYDIERKGT
jgi:hypothetical protein